MKRFTLRGVLDGLRSSVSAPTKSDTEIEETLRSDHFHISKVGNDGHILIMFLLFMDKSKHLALRCTTLSMFCFSDRAAWISLPADLGGV